MTPMLHASIGTAQSIFFEAGNVTMTQSFSDTPPTDLTELIEHTALFVNADSYVISSDQQNYIRFFDTFTKHITEVALGTRRVVQITLNALVEQIPESDFEVLGKGMRRYIGSADCSVQCVLADGSVWNHTYHRPAERNKKILHATSEFDTFFQRVNGLPAVERIIASNNNDYINHAQNTVVRFITHTKQLCHVTSYTNGTVTWEKLKQLDHAPYEQLTVQHLSKTCTAFYITDGRVKTLDPDEQDLLPQYIQALSNVIQIESIRHMSKFSWYVLTSDQRLHVILPNAHWFENFEEGDFEIISSEPAIACTGVTQATQLYVGIEMSVSFAIVCKTPQQTLFKVFDDQSNVEIPDHLVHMPPPPVGIGDLTLQPCSVACSQGPLFVIQPDQSVVSIQTDSDGLVTTQTAHRNAVAIAAGWDHLLVLHTDGTVSGKLIGTPREHHNQHIVPVGLTSVVAISCGEWMSYALRSDGTVVAWGRNDQDQVMPGNYLTGIMSVHGGRHHALFLGEGGRVQHIGSKANNDADTYPRVRTDIKRLHSADIRAIAITTDNRVVDVFDDKVLEISKDIDIVDVVATRGGYALQYKNGRVVILNRYSMYLDDEDPVYTDPIFLSGISSMYANGDVLVCVGFDGRVYSLSSSDQGGFDPIPLDLPIELRVQPWSTLTQVPEDYDADACHEANTLALRLSVIKQTNTYMHAPHKPTF